MSTATAGLRVATAAGVCRVTIAHPPLNVMTTAILDELAEVLSTVASRPDVKVVLLTGEGRRAFCAGVDVSEHTAERVGDMMAAFARAVDALLGVEVPVVAALNGAALGGGLELALACDIVLAREGVQLGQPEIRLGVFPPVAAVLLQRLTNRQVALDLILTGRTILAAEARTLGLVAAELPGVTFESDVDAYVARFAAVSGPVVRLAKRAVMQGIDRPRHEALREADRLYLEELMPLHDPHEGIAAFMEKRAPRWRDA
jgi:cyclohexa-1,5-dienecarbonyl-CoA hydratase